MTNIIAATRSPVAALINPIRRGQIIGRAANDNGGTVSGLGHSAELRAALKHFAQHGLGAATVARHSAEQAFFSGDRRGYLHWLGICRTLDQRMATVLSSQVETGTD